MDGLLKNIVIKKGFSNVLSFMMTGQKDSFEKIFLKKNIYEYILNGSLFLNK